MPGATASELTILPPSPRRAHVRPQFDVRQPCGTARGARRRAVPPTRAVHPPAGASAAAALGPSPQFFHANAVLQVSLLRATGGYDFMRRATSCFWTEVRRPGVSPAGIALRISSPRL